MENNPNPSKPEQQPKLSIGGSLGVAALGIVLTVCSMVGYDNLPEFNPDGSLSSNSASTALHLYDPDLDGDGKRNYALVLRAAATTAPYAGIGADVQVGGYEWSGDMGIGNR